jgi:hypothetical protein
LMVAAGSSVLSNGSSQLSGRMSHPPVVVD